MSKQTLSILTNKDIIALNQDPLFYQARRMQDYGDLEVWAKPLHDTMSGVVAVTLLNRSKVEQEITFDLKKVGITAAEGYTMKELWTKATYNRSTEPQRTFKVPAHGVVVLKINGTAEKYNVFQYE